MNQINLDEFLNESKLWVNIHSLQNLDVFKVITPENLTALHSLQFGQRTVYDKFANLDTQTLCELIISQFNDKWKQLTEYTVANSLDLGLDQARKVKETISETGSNDSVNNSINKVSAFNTDTLIDNDGNETKGSVENSSEKVRTLVDGNLSINNLITNLSLLERTNIINVVLKDVSDFITLSIY